jgi:hypothetical protein
MKRREFLLTIGYTGLALPAASKVVAASVPCPPPSVSISGGSSATTTCSPAPTSPPAADLPQYMSGMSAFEVRDLTTVSGGKTTMFATLPQEWQVTGQPNGADMVFSAWSGGAADNNGLRLFVHGGGHFDSSNNGLYVYDFNGSSAPVGWKLAPNSLSALSAVVQSAHVYSDGKPCAVHSYDGLWYDPNLNRFYRFGGSGFGPGGGGISAAFYYSFATSSWVPFISDSRIGTTLGSSLVGAPNGSKVLYLASTKSPLFVSTSSGAAAAAAGATAYGDAMSGSEESGFATAMDTTRSNVSTGVCRYVSFYHDNSGARAKIVTVNWPGSTFTVASQALTGTYAGELNASGPCVAYDAKRDSFWVFANSNDTSDGQISSLYEVSATSFAVSKSTLSRPIQTLTNNRGGFNRHIWFPNWRIIGTVHAHNQPMSLIKLPG